MTGRDMMGNPVTLADQISAGTLENEESRNIEIGFAYNQNTVFQANDQFSLKTVVFQNNLDNLIARNNDGAPGDPVFINIDKANIRGVELEAAYESETLFGSLAYTALEGENESDPSALNPDLEDRIPSNTVVLSIGTHIPSANLELGWTGTYYESKSRTISFRGLEQDIDTPSNLIHDVYTAWTPDDGLLEDITFRIGISNLADEEYRTHLQDPAVRRAGRSINFTVERTF